MMVPRWMVRLWTANSAGLERCVYMCKCACVCMYVCVGCVYVWACEGLIF